jgi:hypothetical protein
MTSSTLHPLAADYLERFRSAAEGLSPERRDDLAAEIESHLAEALPSGATEAQVRSVLDHLGDPAEIVAAEESAPESVVPGHPRLTSSTDSAPRRRHRWVRWTVLGLVIFVTGAAATASATVLNYQPLSGGGKAWPVPRGIDAKLTHGYWLDAGGGEQLPPQAQFISIPSHPGLTFTYRFSFFNKGKAPVTITGIGVPPSVQRADGGPIATPIAFQTGLMEMAGEGWAPMRPFTVGEREVASVEVRVQVLGCADGSVEWNHFPVSFRVLGVDRHDVLPTNVEIYLAGQSSPC